MLWENGDPGGTRTPYLQIRNLSLYPDELRDHTGSVCPILRHVSRCCGSGLLFPAGIIGAKAMATGPKAGVTCLGLVTEKDTAVPLHPFARRTVKPSIDVQVPVATIADMPAKDQPTQIFIINGVVTDHHDITRAWPAAARSRTAASRPISACLRAVPQA